MTDIAALAAEATEWQSATFTARGTLTRPGLARRAYDHATKTEPLVPGPPVWSGRCRAQTPQGVDAGADLPAGAETVPVVAMAGALPRYVRAQPGDVLTLTEAPQYPALVGVPIVLDSIAYNSLVGTALHWRGHIETGHGVPA